MFDKIRHYHQDLGFAVYAYEPGGEVTFEIHAPEGQFTFKAPTLEAALLMAFPTMRENPPYAPEPKAEPEWVGAFA